jgi:hypothetical protein
MVQNIENLPTNHPVSLLLQEYETRQALFQAQPPLVQRFLEAQARQLAEGFVQRLPHVHFMLPDRVVIEVGGQARPVPPQFRKQSVGQMWDRLFHRDVRAAIRNRFMELGSDSNQGVVVSACLLRHAAALYMIQGMLPAGRSVEYATAEGEEIPTIPVSEGWEVESAITAQTDAIVEEDQAEDDRGELLVPYVPAARRFYLPKWVAFDDQDHLLVGSLDEAEAHLASMQRYLSILHTSVYLAPYLVADEDYQRKRYGMLGQYINQGRAMARYRTAEIIQTIQRRAATQSLNRGLRLILPYLDDQDLCMKPYPFEVIPPGRIMFVPAFVVRAAREEQARVSQDTRLSPSTRKYLLRELDMLEMAFRKDEG